MAAVHWLKECGLLPIKSKTAKRKTTRPVISLPFDQGMCETCRSMVDGTARSHDAYDHSGFRLEVGNVLHGTLVCASDPRK